MFDKDKASRLPSDDASTLPEDVMEKMNDRLAALEASLRAAVSEAEHASRRAAADLAHARKFGIEEFARMLLPFKDALESALAVETDDVDALRTGLELCPRQLQTALEKNGLIEICPAPGDSFDAQRHQPLVKLGAEDGMKIACTEQKGYEINGRLLRPAFVLLQ